MSTTTEAITYSRNQKLWTGMTKTDAQNSGKKIVIEFSKADKNNDETLTLDEITQYNSDKKKDTIKKVLIGVGVATVVGTGTYLLTKKIKANNAAKMMDFDKALKANAKDAFADVVPDNFKGKGISYLVKPEASATPAYKLKLGKNVEETLKLNKEVGLELVQDAAGNYKYGFKNPWTGWENLPGWKNEHGSLSFQELKKIYPQITSDMYFCPAGPGITKAYGAELAKDGTVAIKKEFNNIANEAFQANASQGPKGARNLVNKTHVLEDGSPINFKKLNEGWTMVRKGQYNPANPSQPLPVRQTVIGFKEERTLSTLEGPITTAFAMTDGGGFPYNKFKDFWKQLVNHKIDVDPMDPNSVKMFEQAKIWEKLSKEAEALKAAGNTNGTKALEAQMEKCQNIVKELIIKATL